MNRLSFRPRPLDIHKKLPIVKSIKEFEDEDAPTATSTRSSQLLRAVAEADREVHKTAKKKVASEIPIPQVVVVDTYERDYGCTFRQPTSYIRGRRATAELGEFVEYDLDNEDEDWLQEFNNEREILSPEKFESLLFKLEVLDHKARERGGVIALTFGSPVPVLLQLDAATEVLQPHSVRYAAFQSVYTYWKEKRERWQKPILRHLQPPPPASDTNPYYVFRPREKVHRLHTRRLQRRENNVLSFEKLCQVRHNLEQAKAILDTLIKREEKKREVVESEVGLQRIRMKYKHEAQFIEDGLALASYPSHSCKFRASEEFADLHDMAIGHVCNGAQKRSLMDYKVAVVRRGHTKWELKRQHVTHGWHQERDPHEPILLFTEPLDSKLLSAACIVAPSVPPVENGSFLPSYQFHGRIGRGGRIIFDRWKSARHG